MAFVIQKISNYGVSHPVVARLSVQTSELIKWAALTNDEQAAVFQLYHDDLQPRLLKCHEAFARLIAAREKSITDLQPQSDPRVRSLPHIIGLRGEVETYLYEAKNFLRDLLRVIKIFFGQEFTEASALYDANSGRESALVQWSVKKFGVHDPFTDMLRTEQPWVEDIIRNRNAVEHPGGSSGTLTILNCEASQEGIIPPTWARDGRPRSDLYNDIEVGLDNILTLAEDLLVSCIHHRLAFPQIVFVGLPADKRNPECPQRISVDLSPELRAKLPKV